MTNKPSVEDRLTGTLLSRYNLFNCSLLSRCLFMVPLPCSDPPHTWEALEGGNRGRSERTEGESQQGTPHVRSVTFPHLLKRSESRTAVSVIKQPLSLISFSFCCRSVDLTGSQSSKLDPTACSRRHPGIPHSNPNPEPKLLFF